MGYNNKQSDEAGCLLFILRIVMIDFRRKEDQGNRSKTGQEKEESIMLRIGMLTSGGDCQALNAAMRGVVKGICSKRDDVEIYGFKDGYKGLIYADFSMLTSKDFSGILTRGGTILGTSRQPFKLMRVPDKDGLDKVEAMKHTYHKLNLNCLVILGGNGTHKTANMLSEEGLNVITLPKTIDNDLWGTDMTFGFQSAVDIATDTIDRIHTTATSHSRVFIIEVMGHKVGHVTLHAGIAGGADIILLPEIPYDIKSIAKVIDGRTKAGKPFTILAVAEGAISKKDAKLSKKEYKEKVAKRKYPSIAYELAEQIPDEKQRVFTLSGVIVASDKFINRDYLEQLRRRINMTQLGRLYEKEKIEYGNQKAEATAKKVTREMALKMLEEDVDIITIMKVTGFSEDELTELQKETSITV